MTETYSELVIGGVLVAPFVTHLVCTLLTVLLLRPVVRRLGFEAIFSHPPVAECSLFLIILACFVTLS